VVSLGSGDTYELIVIVVDLVVASEERVSHNIHGHSELASDSKVADGDVHTQVFSFEQVLIRSQVENIIRSELEFEVRELVHNAGARAKVVAGACCAVKVWIVDCEQVRQSHQIGMRNCHERSSTIKDG